MLVCAGTRCQTLSPFSIALVCNLLQFLLFTRNVGRYFIILLYGLCTKLNTARSYTAAAIFKWACMIANGKPVNALTVPNEQKLQTYSDQRGTYISALYHVLTQWISRPDHAHKGEVSLAFVRA